MVVVDEQNLLDLFKFYTSLQAAGLHKSHAELLHAQEVCAALFALDYEIELIQNTGNNQYCASYPAYIVLLKREKSNQNAKQVNASDVLTPLFMSSRFSRVHGRFAVPVILFRNKNICRSATISVHVESIFNNVHAKTKELLNYLYFGPESNANTQAPMSFDLDAQRYSDIKLLESLGIRYVCDLMVENRKKLYGVALTSSEKVDPNYDNELEISALPYPGCEFFKDYKDNGHDGCNLFYNWNQSFVDAQIDLCRMNVNSKTDWSKYKEWDIVNLTSNYLRMVLDLVQDPEPTSGVLVHCISGWDRTPLFISLLRLSLWADGVIHQSLNALQVLYLTLAYDWMLFTHQLGLRLGKGEDIIHFCFNFLKVLSDSSFSVHSERTSSILTTTTSSSSRSLTSFSRSSNSRSSSSSQTAPLALQPSNLSSASGSSSGSGSCMQQLRRRNDLSLRVPKFSSSYDLLPDLDLISPIRQQRQKPQMRCDDGSPSRSSSSSSFRPHRTVTPKGSSSSSSSPINIPRRTTSQSQRHHHRTRSLSSEHCTPSSDMSSVSAGGSDSWQLVTNLPASQSSSRSSRKSTCSLAVKASINDSQPQTPTLRPIPDSQTDFNELQSLPNELHSTPISNTAQLQIENYFTANEQQSLPAIATSGADSDVEGQAEGTDISRRSEPSDPAPRLHRFSFEELSFSDLDLEENCDEKLQKEILSAISNGLFDENSVFVESETSESNCNNGLQRMSENRLTTSAGSPRLLRQRVAQLPGSQDCLMFTLEQDEEDGEEEEIVTAVATDGDTCSDDYRNGGNSAGSAQRREIKAEPSVEPAAEHDGIDAEKFRQRKERLLVVRQLFLKIWDECLVKTEEQNGEGLVPGNNSTATAVTTSTATADGDGGNKAPNSVSLDTAQQCREGNAGGLFSGWIPSIPGLS